MTTIRHTIFARSAALIGAAAVTFVLVSPANAASDREMKRPSAKAAKALSKEEAAANPNVLYCVEGAITGSRIHRPKVCKTRSEWIKQTGVDPIEE